MDILLRSSLLVFEFLLSSLNKKLKSLPAVTLLLV